MADGTLLEVVVAAIEVSLADVPNTLVQRDVTILDSRGISQQFDVLVTIPTAGRQLRIGIECKDHANPVKKETIQAFSFKCKESNIHKAVIVAKSGYQKGAKETAQAHDVELLVQSEVNRATIHSLLNLDKMTLKVPRFRILGCGVIAPAAPAGVMYDECEVVDAVWKQTSRVLDFAAKLIEADPPPPPAPDDKIRITGQFTFEQGTVSCKWKGIEFAIEGIQVEVEHFIEAIDAPRVRSSTQTNLEDGERRSDAVSYCANVIDEKVHMTFVQSNVDGSLKLVAEVPHSLTRSSVRSDRIRELLDSIAISSNHEEIPVTMRGPEEESQHRPRIDVIKATATMKSVPAGARGNADKLYLSDKRTAIELGELVLYLFVRSNPPMGKIAEGGRKRIKTDISIESHSVFSKSTRGFVPLSVVHTELEFHF